MQVYVLFHCGVEIVVHTRGICLEEISQMELYKDSLLCPIVEFFWKKSFRWTCGAKVHCSVQLSNRAHIPVNIIQKVVVRQKVHLQ